MDTIDIEITRDRLKTIEINCVRRCITERGVSQKWIASKLNKTTNTVNGWCSNRVQPHLVDLCLISMLLKCSLHELIEDIKFENLFDEGK